MFAAFHGCSPHSSSNPTARWVSNSEWRYAPTAFLASKCHHKPRIQPLLLLRPISEAEQSSSRFDFFLRSSSSSSRNNNNPKDEDGDAQFLRSELERVESMEEILEELEEYYLETTTDNGEATHSTSPDSAIGFDNANEEDGVVLWSEETLSDIFSDLPDDYDDDDNVEDDDYHGLVGFGSYGDEDDEQDNLLASRRRTNNTPSPLMEDVVVAKGQTGDEAGKSEEADDDAGLLPTERGRIQESAAANLERALLQGVVPASANVGSDCLPGDFGFDPLNLSDKDYFRYTQNYILNLLPESKDDDDDDDDDNNNNNNNNNHDEGQAAVDTKDHGPEKPRPRALILRDYREAEIRHGRLAMLAAVFWPLQEMLDQLLLDPDQAGPLIYGPVTLPYFPLLMTLIMLLLGYLDIYSQAIKDRDSIGEAFLPGDCFWDPLSILSGAPDSMKRNMQERELFNGRVAMIAVIVFTWEEATTHLSLVDIEGNELLLKPAYQVPYIQQWLDSQFS